VIPSFIPEIERASHVSSREQAVQDAIATALFLATGAASFAIILSLVWTLAMR